MTASRWIAVAVAVAAFVVAGVLLWRFRPLPGTAPPPVSDLPARQTPPAFGVASCSGLACHGGTPTPDALKASPAAALCWLPEDLNASASAATRWRHDDRHAHAFAALQGDAARRMMEHLDRKKASKRPATLDERCLACHTIPTTVYARGTRTVDESPAAWARRREGVGCEACHGSAEKWLSDHTTWGHQPAELKAKYQQYGMTWLNDPGERAEVCVGCHVGTPPNAAGLPVRAVTHELIAAGHPRLAFEFVSYQKAMPPHWVERDRTRPPIAGRRGTEHAARTWLIGQTAGAEAALLLLQDAAVRPDWPEFAHFDCYACHHHLEATSWRRPAPGGGLGVLVGGTWDVSLPLRQLTADRPALRQALADIREGMRSCDVAAIQYAAATAAVEICACRKDPPSINSLAKALRDVLANKEMVLRLHWDEAAQLCLALEAWGDAAGGGPEGFAAAHDELAAVLRIRRSTDQTWNSPKGYAPAAVAPRLEALRVLLDRWLKEGQPPPGN